MQDAHVEKHLRQQRTPLIDQCHPLLVPWCCHTLRTNHLEQQPASIRPLACTEYPSTTSASLCFSTSVLRCFVPSLLSIPLQLQHAVLPHGQEYGTTEHVTLPYPTLFHVHRATHRGRQTCLLLLQHRPVDHQAARPSTGLGLPCCIVTEEPRASAVRVTQTQ